MTTAIKTATRFACVSAVLCALGLFASPAASDDTDSTAGGGAFVVESRDTLIEDDSSGSGGTNGIRWELGKECTENVACIGDPCEDPGAREFWLTGYNSSDEIVYADTTCISDNAEELTLTRILTAFREIPLPTADLKIQPPGGKTLVNFETNFYSDDTALSRTVHLLGHQVDFDIWIDTYRWHYGDGTTRETSNAGAPYPALTITHNYLQTGTYHPSLDAVYAANFRVDGGAWRPVGGTVTIDGSATELRAIEATPTLVDYRG